MFNTHLNSKEKIPIFILTRMLVFSLSFIERDLENMAKTLKPNLDKDELNTLYRANLAYAKNTHEHFFKTKKI